MSDLIETFGEIVRADAAFPVDFDLAWQWLGYASKQKGKEALERNFLEGEDYHINQKVKVVKRAQGGGTASDSIMLSADCFKGFAMMAGTEKGKEVRRYFLQCEKMLAAVVMDARARKLTRRTLTDSLVLSGEVERTHGHAFSLYTDLIYRAVLGMDARHYREACGLDPKANVRDAITAAQAESVRKYEDLARSMVDMGVPYEQIKATIQTMATRKLEAVA